MAHEIDVDPQETREWLESLDSAIEREGAERAHFLIERLIDQARRSGAHLPYTATTAYVNTIRKSDEEKLRGEPGLEHRLRSIVAGRAGDGITAPALQAFVADGQVHRDELTCLKIGPGAICSLQPKTFDVGRSGFYF